MIINNLLSDADLFISLFIVATRIFIVSLQLKPKVVIKKEALKVSTMLVYQFISQK